MRVIWKVAKKVTKTATREPAIKRVTRSRILPIAALVLLFPCVLRAGGPAWVAGAGYNQGVEGQPLLWTSATVNYYTDQGDLSPILPGPQAVRSRRRLLLDLCSRSRADRRADRSSRRRRQWWQH